MNPKNFTIRCVACGITVANKDSARRALIRTAVIGPCVNCKSPMSVTFCGELLFDLAVVGSFQRIPNAYRPIAPGARAVGQSIVAEGRRRLASAIQTVKPDVVNKLVRDEAPGLRDNLAGLVATGKLAADCGDLSMVAGVCRALRLIGGEA